MLTPVSDEKEISNPPRISAPTFQENKTHFTVSPETWIAVGILVLTLAAYLQVAWFQFVSFDDPLYITSNPIIQSGLNKESIRYAFTTGDDGSYLPLVWLSHAVCVSVFGTWAGGHHLVNLLLHLANSILLFYFLIKLTKSTGPSACVAFLFALHPLHVESVAWVSERKDVLSTLFWILTSWAYLHYVERPSLRRYTWMIVLFILGLLSKSMLVTLPLTLLLFDVWPLQRIDLQTGWRALGLRMLRLLIIEKAPLLALSLGAAATTLLIQKAIGAVAITSGFPIYFGPGNAGLAITKYLWQAFWPIGLSAFYPFTWSTFPVWKVVWALVFILTISVVCLRNLKDRPYLAVGWFWYLITLLPVVGIIQVGSQSHADRYTYVPLIGIFLMLSWLAGDLIARWQIRRLPILVAGATLLAVMTTLTVAQVVVWRDNVTLFKNALALDIENPAALLHIGDEYFNRGQYQNAYATYHSALKQAPSLYLTYGKIGRALEAMGREALALPYYQHAQRLKPGMLGLDQSVGHILTNLGRYDEAEPYIQKVIQRPEVKRHYYFPTDAFTSYTDWAVILRSRGKLDEAASVLNRVLDQDPNFARARMNLGLTLAMLGHLEDALREMERAVATNPDDAEVVFHLAGTLAALRRFPESKDVLEQLRKKHPESPLVERGFRELERTRQLKAKTAART